MLMIKFMAAKAALKAKTQRHRQESGDISIMVEHMGTKSPQPSFKDKEPSSKRKSLQLNQNEVLIEEHKNITKIFTIYVISYVAVESFTIGLVYYLNIRAYINDGGVSALEIIL